MFVLLRVEKTFSNLFFTPKPPQCPLNLLFDSQVFFLNRVASFLIVSLNISPLMSTIESFCRDFFQQFKRKDMIIE